MIKCNECHVMVSGTGENIIKDWVCITAAVHENLSEVIGVEKANAILTQSLFAAVTISNSKENEE